MKAGGSTAQGKALEGDTPDTLYVTYTAAISRVSSRGKPLGCATVPSSVFPREEPQCKCAPQTPVPSGNDLSIPYVSTFAELPFLLGLLFVLHLIQGKAASLSQILEDSLG